MDMCSEQKFAHALIEQIADVMETLYVNMVTPLAPQLTWIEFASDYGTQNAPFISPRMYRDFLKGPESRIFAAVKKAAPEAKIFMHSCGSVKRLIPDLIEAGVEILSALQPLAFEMDSAALKREFGGELVFHGGIDMQQALVGRREQTMEETRCRIADYAPGGGYIIGPSNHFTSDVPVENFFALYTQHGHKSRFPVSEAPQARLSERAFGVCSELLISGPEGLKWDSPGQRPG